MANEVKLLLKSKKKQSKDGRKFRTYFTDVMILVKGEEEKGKQRKTLTVKFDKDCPNTSTLVRGIITCDEKDIDLPFKYQVVTKDNGKESYPTIYIRNFKSYEEKRGQSSIEFITEDETEDTTIDEEEVVESEEDEQ